MKGQRRERTQAVREHAGLSLLAVQSTVCGVVLLIALLLRLAGGETWDQLRELLHRHMTADGIGEMVSEQLSEDGVGGRDVTIGGAVSVSVLSVELSAEAAPLSEGVVTSPFGYRIDPLDGGTGYHTGVDIAAAENTPLFAVCDGTITAATRDSDYGNYVTLTTEAGVSVTYAHCSKLVGCLGATVRAGEVVAYVGNTGRSTGPHVHISVQKDGAFYDPKPLIPEAFYA